MPEDSIIPRIFEVASKGHPVLLIPKTPENPVQDHELFADYVDPLVERFGLRSAYLGGCMYGDIEKMTREKRDFDDASCYEFSVLFSNEADATRFMYKVNQDPNLIWTAQPPEGPTGLAKFTLINKIE